MALVLVIDYAPYNDRTTIAVDDVTGDCGETSWGAGSNPNRADRCLVFWTKYIDYQSNESYVTQQVATQGQDLLIGIGDGEGLSNTDKSRFLVDYLQDGHHIFYMLPIERFASAPAGASGSMYFNTTDKVVYIYESSTFRALVPTDLPNIEGYAGIAVCEDIFDLNKRVCLNKKTRELKFVLSDDDERRIKNTKEDIRELRNGDLLWNSTFKEGKQPTSRQLIKNAEDECR